MNSEDRLTGILKLLMMILGAAVLIVSGILIYHTLRYRAEDEKYESIRQTAYRAEESGDGERQSFTGSAVSGNVPENGEAPEDLEAPENNPVDLEALRRINEDTAGWITACGGRVDYPVVQAGDDEYYLSHLFDKSEGSAGTLFADRLSEPAFFSPVTVIYGHNRKDGSMFHSLINYKAQEYYNANPDITVYTLKGEKHYRIFAAFYSDHDDIPGVGARYRTDEKRDTLYAKKIFEEASSRSLYETDISNEAESMVSSIEKNEADIIILCTCEYSGNDNRMAVYGIYDSSGH